jgi:hypothetical protein
MNTRGIICSLNSTTNKENIKMYTIIYGKERAQFLPPSCDEFYNELPPRRATRSFVIDPERCDTQKGALFKAAPFEVLFSNNEIRVVVTRKNRKYSVHAYNLHNNRVCMRWARYLGTLDNEGGLTELRRSDVGFLLHRLSLLDTDQPS